MQPEKAPTNQCVLTPIFQPSVSCQFSRSSHFSAFIRCNFHTCQNQWTSILVVFLLTAASSSLSHSYDQVCGAIGLYQYLHQQLQLYLLDLRSYIKVPVFFPRANTLAPFVTFQVPPTNNIACPSSSSCPIILHALRSGICQTFSSNQTNPLGNNIRASPIPTTSKAEPSAKYTLPKSPAT